MRIRKVKSIICNDEGSAIGLFVMVLLAMTILATTTVTLANTQFKWSQFSRQTSNSYQLARSGAEKTIDNMNKEIATVLPKLMDKASKNAHATLMGATGVKYEIDPAKGNYAGEYKGAAYENQYEIELKKLMYTHIVGKFAHGPFNTSPSSETVFNAAKSDVKGSIPIQVKTTIYKYGDIIPPEVVAASGVLLEPSNIGATNTDVSEKTRAAFAVEVLAWAEEVSGGGSVTKPSVTKSRVVGLVSLDQDNKGEQLLEEYEWADAFPEVFQSAITSFGDFIIHGANKATIKGDISVKGTGAKAKIEASEQMFPEPPQFGGIVITDGGELTVEGNALVVNNIQTANTVGGGTNPATSIHIKKDAIAQTVAINDNASNNDSGASNTPWLDYVANNTIKIDRNIYMDNDLHIDRYVKSSEIEVGQSVFGVSDGDKKGVTFGNKVYVDPNKSSGIYAMGKFGANDGTIKMKRAFIAGQAFIDFGDGNGFHRLHESVGEPFEDVYYLDEYRAPYSKYDETDIVGGDSNAYLTDLAELINSDRITIQDKSAYAPARISETGTSSSVPANFQAKEIFYAGLVGGVFPSGIENALTGSSDWDEPILGIGTNPKWKDVILAPESFYGGTNPFLKNYFQNPDSAIPDAEPSQLLAYKGLQGYMLGKRGVFYNHFVAGGTSGLIPVERKFADLINTGAFGADQGWSRNNPIQVITGGGEIEVDISAYYGKPTAIISTNPAAILKLKATGGSDFTGIIVTPGKVNITESMTIHGVVIAGNEFDPATHVPDIATIANIRQGNHAGVQISNGAQVTFKYDVTDEKDRNILFDIRFMDKSLQRRLYDYLRLTNYGTGTTVDQILGPEGKHKVKLSNESVISSDQDGLQFTMKSLKKIKSN